MKLYFSVTFSKSIVCNAYYLFFDVIRVVDALITYLYPLSGRTADMARGHQKFQSQQKNAKKQAEIKKSKGHDQKAAAKAALVYTCTVCRVRKEE